MQNQGNFFKKTAERTKIKRGETLLHLHNKLKSKTAEQTRERGMEIAKGALMLFASFILSRGELLFDTSPLSIALICATKKYYVASAIGGIMGAIVGEVGVEYAISCAFALFVRLFISFSFMPNTFLEKSSTGADPEREESEGFKNLYGRKSVLYKIKMTFYKLFGIKESGAYAKSFSEIASLRLPIAAASGFLAGLIQLIKTEFSYYSLAATVFMMLACPFFSFVFSGLFCDDEKSLMSTLSAVALMLLCVYASGDMSIFTLAISPFLAMLFTLIACRSRGGFAGAVVAIFLGAFSGAECIVPLVLSAIVFSLFFFVKRGVAMALVAGVCVVWSYYFFDVSAFVVCMPPMLLALPIFLVLDKLCFSPSACEVERFEENKYFAKSVSEESKNLAVKEKVSLLSEAFSSLSEAVNSLSDKFSRPDILKIREITDKGFLEVCEGCPGRDVCFGAEYDRTIKTAGRIAASIHNRGVVEEGDLGEEFSAVCVRRKKLIERMNSLCEEKTEGILRSHNLSFFAASYDDIKDILQDAIATGGEEYECDISAAGEICEYLASEGYSADGVVVCGKRCRRVMIKGVEISSDAGDGTAMNLRRKIGEIVGSPMVGPVLELSEDGMLMMFSAKPKLRAVCAGGRRAAFECECDECGEQHLNPFDASVNEKRDELCGDVTNAFLTDSSYFYSLISDGMGSGEDAAVSAGIVSTFCEKMLMAGNRADITIRMLNNFLRGENAERGAECSVTVDLFELDLMLGVASFIKSGAAPTYVLRGGEVFRVSSKTMPIGIIKNPDIKITRFDMKRGDLVLMMSDGIFGESDECDWIVEEMYKEKIPPTSEELSVCEGFVSSMRDRLLDLARERMIRAGKHDDISLSIVLVL